MPGGEVYFAIGLSEPNAGSDLAAVTTKAKKVSGGWRVTGNKVWTSGAHHAHYMITLARSAPRSEDRRAGLSQYLIDLAAPGVTIRPIRLMNGEHHFNEVLLDNVFVPDERVIGDVGNGWKQSIAELAYERSGPERFLSTFPLLAELVRFMQREKTGERGDIALGLLTARLVTLRDMSLGVAALLEKDIAPEVAAALVKDLGTQFEKDVIEVTRQFVTFPQAHQFDSLFTRALLQSPGFTFRGGTTEILRGIIARGVGIR